MMESSVSDRAFVASIEAEFRRYKALAEGAIDQLEAGALAQTLSSRDSSIATIAWHIAGNLTSRFTDFLESDGEKPWRDRESEFEPRNVSRDELYGKWEAGWGVLFTAISALHDGDLTRGVSIRGVTVHVHEALHRALAHVCYHVGQIVYRSKQIQGDEWSWLSIPPGGSSAYNRNPTYETPADHAARLDPPAS